MELDEINKTQIKRLYAFLRTKRDRHLRELDDVASDIKDERMGETIYNQEDVVCLLDEYGRMVKEIVRQELDGLGNMIALYSSDMLQQAQGQGIQVAGDVSIIEDQSRLSMVAELAEYAGNAAAPVRKPNNLAALSGAPTQSNAAALQEENRVLQERFEAMQKQLTDMMRERSSLAEELAELKKTFSTVKAQMGAEMQNNSAVKNMETQLQSTRSLLENKSSEIEKIRNDMNRRLADSHQFKELKGIVAKKNAQIKALRDRLGKYEDDDDAVGLIREEQ